MNIEVTISPGAIADLRGSTVYSFLNRSQLQPIIRLLHDHAGSPPGAVPFHADPSFWRFDFEQRRVCYYRTTVTRYRWLLFPTRTMRIRIVHILKL